jgi:flagellar protein FlaG
MGNINNIDSEIKLDNLSIAEVKQRQSVNINNKKLEDAANTEHDKKAEKAEVEKAIDRALDVAKYFNREIHFEVEEELNIMVVKVIDSETEEVIRQIPPEEMVELSKNADDLKGLLIDTEG